MRILIAEDDPVSRRVLEVTLKKWDYEVQVTHDGGEAWAALQKDDCPRLAVLDWMMPVMDGPEICRHVRARPGGEDIYLLLLTAKVQKEDIVVGLESGADDYITKPFHPEELRARISTGRRIIELHERLGERVHELEHAIHQINTLRGLLPICSYCKRIRNEGDYWQAVESYMTEHSEAEFSHGVCPDCYDKIVRPQIDAL